MADVVIAHIREIVFSSVRLSSRLYFAVLSVTGIYFEMWYAVQKRYGKFYCRGAKNQYDIRLCFEKYSNGPNELHTWLYHVYLVPPLALCIIEALIRRWKFKNLLKIRPCRIFHIHLIYVSRLAMMILFHLILTILLAGKVKPVSGYRSYYCLIGNSTLYCLDGETSGYSDLSIACFSCTIVLLVFVVLEFADYFYKWMKAKANKEDQNLDGCKDCNLFYHTFHSGMSSLVDTLRIKLNSLLVLQNFATARKSGIILTY